MTKQSSFFIYFTGDKMFKDLREYIMENEFKITILKDKINIVNYDKIINLTDNEVSLKIENTRIKIYGNNLMLNKLLDREILLTGKASKVEFIYE